MGTQVCNGHLDSTYKSTKIHKSNFNISIKTSQRPRALCSKSSVMGHQTGPRPLTRQDLPIPQGARKDNKQKPNLDNSPCYGIPNQRKKTSIKGIIEIEDYYLGSSRDWIFWFLIKQNNCNNNYDKD